MSRPRSIVTLLLGLVLSAFVAAPVAADDNRPRAVYVQTNDASGNEVIAFARHSDGGLSELGSFASGGLGSGDPLGSQGALYLSPDGRWLLAVNAGSDDVSSFRVRENGRLRLVDRESSGGDRPISVTAHGGLVYVLNAGGSGNIAGLTWNQGDLSPLGGSSRPLSGDATDPAQVSFNPSGEALLLTEKATNQLVTYRVRDSGRTSDPRVFDSAGMTPFGFAFDRHGRAIVSEAAGGDPNASTMSSYEVSDRGRVNVISPAVPTTQTAACWVVITGNGAFAYETNTGSGTISSFAIASDGSIALHEAIAAGTGDGSEPIDMALSRGSRFLYVLEAGTAAVSFFEVAEDGSLDAIGEVTGLPLTSVGLAAR
jgi:6-phosphogluconolactonase